MLGLGAAGKRRRSPALRNADQRRTAAQAFCVEKKRKTKKKENPAKGLVYARCKYVPDGISMVVPLGVLGIVGDGILFC